MATSSVGTLPSTAALPAQEASRTHRNAPTEDTRAAKAKGEPSLRQQQNVQILQASMDVSIQSGDSSLALLYRTAIDRINEFEAVDCRHPEGLKGLELAGLLE